MVDFSDWDSAEDAVYDGPDAEELAAAAKRKAMRDYMDWSQEIEDAIIKSIGQEEYDAREHWINNPLIKPRSKVHLFEQWEARVRKEENEHIVKLLEDVKADLRKKLSEVSGDSQSETYWYSRIQQLDNYIAIIKGEK